MEAGGGHNHRYNLSQAVMLKDNHIGAAGGITAAVAGARAHAPFVCTVEVECETMDMVREALDAGADIIMLDNMTREQMAEAIAVIGGRAMVEASGNVDAGNIRELADLGVDIISSGALTHSAPILIFRSSTCACCSSCVVWLVSRCETGGAEMPLMGHERRDAILECLRGARCAVSGTSLAKTAGVSRQVIVQDIALLRADGHDIVATNRGYVLREGASEPSVPTRLIKVHHAVDQLEEELETIVDLGGTVQSVMVNHRAYGKITANLDIRSRTGIERYLEDIRTGKSTPLMTVTSGYHFHRISATTRRHSTPLNRPWLPRAFWPRSSHTKKTTWTADLKLGTGTNLRSLRF